jgi:hypothetical protein
MTESAQLDLVDQLWEYERAAENSLTALEDALNAQIDANPNDKLLMEMLDVATDASESLAVLRDLLQTMQRRDEENSL